MSAITQLWWRAKGFSEFPRLQEAEGTEILYRVFGGPTSKLYGSCYSLQKPTSVSDAEFNSNIVKWGNRCFYVASFRIKPRTPMYIGKIDQAYERSDEDDGKDVFLWGNKNAEQVWIDPAKSRAVLTHLFTHPLRQDFHVVIPDQHYDV